MTAEVVTRGLYRVEYERLVELGSFHDEKVELIEGQIITRPRRCAAAELDSPSSAP